MLFLDVARLGLGIVLLTGCVAAQPPAPPPPTADDRALPLLQALSDPDLDVRTGAESELRRIAAAVEPTLRRWTSHPDPEVAGRCLDLLEDLDRSRHTPVGRVTSVNAEYGYLYLAPARRLLRGERFEVLRGRSWTATVEFNGVQLTLVDGDLAGLHEYELTVVPGNPEVREAARAVPVEGAISMIDDETATVEISFRSRDGVQAGEVCDVIRGDRVVGRVLIAKVQACASVVIPMGATRLEDLRRWDRIARRG